MLEAAILKAVQAQIQERKRLEDAKSCLYDNLEKGILNQDEYLRFMEEYNTEITEQEGQIRRLQTAMAEFREARRQDDEFVSYFERYGNIDRLDRETLERLANQITVEDAAHIHIYFKSSPERGKLPDFAGNVEEETTSAAARCNTIAIRKKLRKMPEASNSFRQIRVQSAASIWMPHFAHR